MSNDLQAATSVLMINPASCADTAAATSAWIDVRDYEGDIEIIQQVGAVTGSITGVIKTSAAADGSNPATLTPKEGAFTAVSSANNCQRRTIGKGDCLGWLAYAGTVATGPAITAVSLLAKKKYTT